MKTLKLRIKDKYRKTLTSLAKEVNMVWNYCNDLSLQHIRRERKFLNKYDFSPFLTGTSALCNLHSQTIQAVAEEFATRRKQFKKIKLKWRVSNPKSSRKSLGWVPFKASAIRYKNGQLHYGKRAFGLWDSYGLSAYAPYIKSGSFVEDSRGRWYVCLSVDLPEHMEKAKASLKEVKATSMVGIDLGLKHIATCSDGTVITNPKVYYQHEKKLATAQRAKKKKQVKNIHAKIKNTRQDNLHKASSSLVNNNAAVVVGDLSAAKLIKTQMAKSTLDSGFARMKTMLRYKCERAGVLYIEVKENYTTQTCSCCGGNPSSSPKGRAGLRIRVWTCSLCGTTHDRDINSAKAHDKTQPGIFSVWDIRRYR